MKAFGNASYFSIVISIAWIQDARLTRAEPEPSPSQSTNRLRHRLTPSTPLTHASHLWRPDSLCHLTLWGMSMSLKNTLMGDRQQRREHGMTSTSRGFRTLMGRAHSAQVHGTKDLEDMATQRQIEADLAHKAINRGQGLF